MPKTLGRNFVIDSVSVIEEWTTLKGETPMRLERFQGSRLERGHIPTICSPDETPMGPEHIKTL
jgi:hypothetical protein